MDCFMSQQTGQLLIFKPSVVYNALNFGQIVFKETHVCVPLRDLKDVLADSVRKLISIAKHHGELEQLIVVENIKDGINELFVNLIETDDELVDFNSL